jgi:hypothetical protein
VGRSIAARRSGDVIWVGRREEGGGSDGWGLLGSDVRERKLEEEAPFGKYPKVAQAEWAERAHGGLQSEAGRGWAGWAGIGGKIISE